jgi:hypothetical protein
LARYNPQNRQHRTSLAKRVAKMLLASGFSLEASTTGEDVYVRSIDGVTTGSAQVRVLTSIVAGSMRRVAKDAIRVCAVYTDNAGESRGLVKSTRINRTGDMDAITGRLLTSMRKTYSLARKRANDPSFLALPVPSKNPARKKRWVPRAKKSASRPSSARRPNTAVKAAAETQAETPPIPVFKVGDLVRSRNTHGDFANRKGIVKAVGPSTGYERGSVTVFWLDLMKELKEHARFLMILTS